MNIRPLEEGDYNSVNEITEKLKQNPEETGWFTEEARKKMIPFDIKVQKGFVSEEDGKVVGFITYTSYDYRPIIGWIGVDTDYHRKGVGRELVKAVEEEIKKFGGEELYVETPSKEVGLGSAYERTYKFYESVGFSLDKIEKGKDRIENCDMAILKKVLK